MENLYLKSVQLSRCPDKLFRTDTKMFSKNPHHNRGGRIKKPPNQRDCEYAQNGRKIEVRR